MADDIIPANQAAVHTRRRRSTSAHTAKAGPGTKTMLSATKTHSISSEIHGQMQLLLTMAMPSSTAHQRGWTLVDTAVANFSAMDNQHQAFIKP